MNFFFENRVDAGKQLGMTLARLRLMEPRILALPRGGVVVGDEVAKILHAPMDVVIARKIAAPDNPEFGIGSISEDEVPHFKSEYLKFFQIEDVLKDIMVLKEKDELRRRIKFYRKGKPLQDLSGKTIIVVDDGLATGVTAEAAASFLRTLNPAKLILAVPVGPTEISPKLINSFDQIVCLKSIENLQNIGMWYREFDQVEDSEVMEVLQKYH